MEREVPTEGGSMITLRTHRTIIGLVAVLGLVGAACGDDDDDASSSSSEAAAGTGAPATSSAVTTAETEAGGGATTAPEDTAAATTEVTGGDTTEPAGPATGEPITFMTIATLESPNFSVPQVQTAIEARVKSINAAGGVNGRPLEAEFCNDRFDPNEAAACARACR